MIQRQAMLIYLPQTEGSGDKFATFDGVHEALIRGVEQHYSPKDKIRPKGVQSAPSAARGNQGG